MIVDCIMLPSNDIQRLEPLLAREEFAHGARLPSHLLELAHRVGHCQEAAPSKIPSSTVTMNSRVLLQDLRNDAQLVYELVFPRDADAASGRISVLAPLGAALLGARVGDVVDVDTPRYARRLLVRELLFQPEAAGRFDL